MTALQKTQEALDNLLALQYWWDKEKVLWNRAFETSDTDLNWEACDEDDLVFFDDENIFADVFPMHIWQCKIRGERKIFVYRRFVSIKNKGCLDNEPAIQWSILFLSNTNRQKYLHPQIFSSLFDEGKLKIKNDHFFQCNGVEEYSMRFAFERQDVDGAWSEKRREGWSFLLSCWASNGSFHHRSDWIMDHFYPVGEMNHVQLYIQ